jgi:hypothetical protein
MMNGKGCGINLSCPNLMYYLGIFLEGLRTTMKNLIQDSWSLGQDLNPRHEYEAGVLTARP